MIHGGELPVTSIHYLDAGAGAGRNTTSGVQSVPGGDDGDHLQSIPEVIIPSPPADFCTSRKRRVRKWHWIRNYNILQYNNMFDKERKEWSILSLSEVVLRKQQRYSFLAGNVYKKNVEAKKWRE